MNSINVFDALRDILLHELIIDDTRINLWNQKFQTPSDRNLFVYIAHRGTTVIRSSAATTLNSEGTYVEEQELNTQERYAIGVFSASVEAFNRKEEVVMALGSIYSRQKQEAVGFKIARNTPIADLSELEGAAMIYRFEIDVACLAFRKLVKVADRYEHFNADVIDN